MNMSLQAGSKNPKFRSLFTGASFISFSEQAIQSASLLHSKSSSPSPNPNPTHEPYPSNLESAVQTLSTLDSFPSLVPLHPR